MGFVQRFERKLEDAVGDAFARVFGGNVVPQEVETALQREASEHIQQMSGGHRLAPNRYVITLGPSDREQMSEDRATTTGALVRRLSGYITDQGWETYGEVAVEFQVSPTLHTGQFRTAGWVDPDADRSHSAHPDAVPARTSRPGAGHMTRESGYDHNRGAAQDDYSDGGRQRAGYGAQAYSAAPQNPQGYPEEAFNEEATYNSAYEQGGYQQEQYAEPQRDPRYSGPGYAGGQPADGFAAPYGQAEADQYYGAQNYSNQGYEGQGYPDQGYAQQGGYDQNYADQNYADQNYQQGYADQGYAGQVAGQGYAAQQGEGQYAWQDYQGGQQQGYAADPATQAYDPYGQQQQGNWAAALTGVLHLEDGSGRTYQLQEGSNVLGRGQDAQFRLPDTGVSRRHADIHWDGYVALLTDLGSTNGTTVNGAPIQDWQLADGDVIHIGHSEIVVRIH